MEALFNKENVARPTAVAADISKDLKGKCGDRLHYALDALLLTKPDFIAMRLHDSFKGWFTDKDLLTRLLGGLDGHKMAGVTQAYEARGPHLTARTSLVAHR